MEPEFLIQKAVDKDNFFEINLHGARKTLTLKGLPILIELDRVDGKIGSTHPCSPNFSNPHNAFGLPQHGPVRNTDWKLMYEEEGSVTLQCYIIGGTYPAGLKLTQTVRLQKNKFEIYTIHTNISKEPMPLIYGEHFYWDTPHGIEDMRINGLELASYKGFPEKFHTVGTVVPFDFQNTLEIPGKPVIELEQENMPVGVLWRVEKDTKYICVEPVTMNPQEDENGKPYFGSEKSMIMPAETKTAYVSISLK